MRARCHILFIEPESYSVVGCPCHLIWNATQGFIETSSGYGVGRGVCIGGMSNGGSPTPSIVATFVLHASALV
jgi:hypothetical protein